MELLVSKLLITTRYNRAVAGALKAMDYVKDQYNGSYVDSIRYDKFGSRARIRYGNGTTSKYTYNSLSRRLANLKTFDASDNLMQDINYNYIANGNIAGTVNSVASVNSLGGSTFSYNSYDSLSRLIWSYGGFTDNNNSSYNYTLNMQYSASGNITQKSMVASTLLGGAVSSVNYTNNYQYAGSTPHAVSSIQDANNNTTHSMNWDANGNMTQLSIPAQGMSRSMCWDEENRLSVVRDPQQLSHYIYNAGGERVWKLTGAIERMSINGEDFIDQANLDKTLYTSPYMILTEQEYTKHYYIESQRVTTKIGGGMANNLVDPINGALDPFTEDDIEEISQKLRENLDRSDCAERVEIEIDSQFGIMEELMQMDNDAEFVYFYHGDHLGSSAWITDGSGNVNQHLAYMPFGEDFVNQRSDRDIRFKFTSKERDTETGFDYFGARYYESDLSVWLSVDPLTSKYPSMSPYMYVRGNPVMLIDKWGLEGDPPKEHSKFRKLVAKVNPWERVNYYGGISKTSFHIGRKSNYRVKTEVLPKEKRDFDIINVVYSHSGGDNNDLFYYYKDAPIKQWNEQISVPNSPFPSGYLDHSELNVDVGDDLDIYKTNWTNVAGKTIPFSIFMDIDPSLKYHWNSSGGRPNGSEITGYSFQYYMRSKPMSMNVPRGIFGIRRWKKATFAPKQKATVKKTKFRRWRS